MKMTKKNHQKPVDTLMRTNGPDVKVGKQGSMVEVLTPEQLIAALFPLDRGTLFVCVRDGKGRVLFITEVGEYLKRDASNKK
jgi:hypothetical protein